MRASIPERLAVVVVVAALSACAPRGPQLRADDIRHFRCDDGTSFSAEITPAVVRIYTVTGTIDLPRQRGQDPPYYTNGLRALIVEPEGTVRHATGRRAWANCEVQTPSR